MTRQLCTNYNYQWCHYSKNSTDKCMNGENCSWCHLINCIDCKKPFCKSCIKETTRCASCEHMEKWFNHPIKCKFCNQSEKLNGCDLYYYREQICGECDRLVCHHCSRLKRIVATNNYTRCIECLVKESGYTDIIFDVWHQK